MLGPKQLQYHHVERQVVLALLVVVAERHQVEQLLHVDMMQLALIGPAEQRQERLIVVGQHAL